MFFRDERAAVSVDLVVMSAGLVGLGLSVGVAASSAMGSLSSNVSDSLRARVGQPGFDEAYCPADWEAMHGRNTGRGALQMRALYAQEDARHGDADLLDALAAFKAHPYDFRYRDPMALAAVQAQYCVAEDRGLLNG